MSRIVEFEGKRYPRYIGEDMICLSEAMARLGSKTYKIKGPTHVEVCANATDAPEGAAYVILHGKRIHLAGDDRELPGFMVKKFEVDRWLAHQGRPSCDAGLKTSEDFLAGRTPRCPGYNMLPEHGCGRRVATMEATLCNGCLDAKNRDDFKEAFARPSTDGKWYLEWVFSDNCNPQGCKAFICRTCGRRDNANISGIPDADGNLVPAAACCTQTMTCKLAEEFWGKDRNAAYLEMVDYVKCVHS